MNWYIKVLKQYADFSGRARRMEYWMFVLFNMLAAFALSIIGFIGAAALDTMLFMVPLMLYGVAIIVPSLAVVVRRLHDSGNSGWMYFVSFIPIIGGIWLLVLMFTDSQPFDNKYGPNPKANEQRMQGNPQQ